MKYNSANAYNFAAFEQREYKRDYNQPRAKITSIQPKIKKEKVAKPQSAAAARFFARVKIIAGIGLVVGLSMLMIFMRVEVGQQEGELRRMRTEITALESEEIRLRMQYENLMNLQNLEIEAIQMGMQRANHSQRIYIRLNRSQNPTQTIQASGN